MFLSLWLSLIRSVRTPVRSAKRSRDRLAGKLLRGLWLEQLEDRTLLTAYQWTGLGATSAWNDPNNWGGAAFPNAPADIARFTGTITGGTTATVNQAITVGEIDFGTSSNITITSSGTNVLTLQSSGANAILDVGQTTTNAGVDVLAAPLSVA